MEVEKSLLEKMHRIFGLKRTTFVAPKEDTIEQDTLFLRIDLARPVIKRGKEIYRIEGQGMTFNKAKTYPVGYFAKRIQLASNDDTKDLFFTNIEENAPVMQDLTRRTFSFLYFFTGDYNPVSGRITEMESTFVDNDET